MNNQNVERRELLEAVISGSDTDRAELLEQAAEISPDAESVIRGGIFAWQCAARVIELLGVTEDEAFILLGKGIYSKQYSLDALTEKVAAHIDLHWMEIEPRLEELSHMVGANGKKGTN